MGNTKNDSILKIARMKKQTFGVEVEMNNITRQKAAKIAAEFFGTGRTRYTDYGYSTYSAWDMQGREWKFASDSSIIGPVDERCEMVTPILKYDDIELLQKLVRVLRKNGAKSSPSRHCGVHIHVGLKGLDGRDHNATTLRILANMMAAHETQIGRAIHIDSWRTYNYCEVVNPEFIARVNRERPDTMQKLADVWYEANHASCNRGSHYNGSRYHMLNLHASFTNGTIEFRLFQFQNEHDGKKGGLHAGELKAYIQLCLAMSERAKSTKYASPKPQQTDNEKYALRCWLLNLGFIGDEFKTAREILLKNMEGNAAWRFAM